MTFDESPVHLTPHQKRWLWVYAHDKDLDWLMKALKP